MTQATLKAGFKEHEAIQGVGKISTVGGLKGWMSHGVDGHRPEVAGWVTGGVKAIRVVEWSRSETPSVLGGDQAKGVAVVCLIAGDLKKER